MIEIVNRKNADAITSRDIFSNRRREIAIARADVTTAIESITDRTDRMRNLISRSAARSISD
jgi:hypothetical protein